MKPEEFAALVDERSSLGDSRARRRRRQTPPNVRRAILAASLATVPAATRIEGAQQHNHERTDADMAGKNNRHVVPNPDGGWDVKAPGAKRASSHHDTQSDAEKRAKEIVRNNGGGEVRIHRPDGTIRDSDTVAPGNDPKSSRDTRH